MLAIRLQRTGRKGHAQFRMIVQESRRTPTSGSVVAMLGQYDPHTKSATLDKEKADFYLKHGAQPSDRVARLLKKEGVSLPKWVQIAPNKSRTIRNPDKLRANRPPEEAAAVSEVADANDDQGESDAVADDKVAAENNTVETPKETVEKPVDDDASSEEAAA